MAEQKKDIVKEIFAKTRTVPDKVSSLFTQIKHQAEPARPPEKAKPLPAGKLLPAAIDIGTSSVKLLQLVEGQNGKIEAACRDREEYSTDKKEAVKRLVSRNKISPDVIASIPARDVQIYNFAFPHMSEPELENAIRWKIAQLRPFGLGIEELIYDYVKWEELPGLKATQQKILAACAPRALVEDLTRMLREEGLKPQAIEIASVSLMHLGRFRTRASAAASAADETVMWLDIGAEESAVLITRGPALYFCRTLTIASSRMTRQIAQHCGVTEKEAEELKRQHGLAFWSPDKTTSVFLENSKTPREPANKASTVYRSLVSILENLVVDIEHSFKYFSYQLTQSQITRFDRVILSGGGSNLKNLERFLAAKLNVPTERAGVFSLPPEFGVAAGLSVACKADPAKRINLMPKEEKKGIRYLAEHLKERPVRAAAIIISLAVFLIGTQALRAGYYAWRVKSWTGRVRTAQVQLRKLQSRQLRMAEEEGVLLEKKARLEGRLNLLDNSTRRPEEFSAALAEIADLLPDKIWATRLFYEEKKINITGSTSDMNLIMQLIESLKVSPNFTDAAFSYSQKDPKRDVYNFEITTEVNQ